MALYLFIMLLHRHSMVLQEYKVEVNSIDVYDGGLDFFYFKDLF